MAEILVIDDEQDMLTACARIIKALGHAPVTIAASKQAVHLMRTHEFDLILCDMFMPEMDGMQVLAEARQLQPNTPVVMFTAYGTVERAVDAMRTGAFDFLEKPFEIDHLSLTLEKGLRQRALFRERSELLRKLEQTSPSHAIIGSSAAMASVFTMINAVAPTDSNVVVTGESGTGKELVARSIHANSKRREQEFIPVNCGALPEELFESELFGYEKGAFTGAVGRKTGLLETAHGGTFFLDEVCELTQALQVKLLRVLQDRQVRRVGGDTLQEVDVRFIAATNRDLELAVGEGRLREDLYYRLNVVRVHVPPLRERREDLPLLAEHFLKFQLKSSEKSVAKFSEEVMRCFQTHDWPGNVRELQNAIECGLAMSQGEAITVADLPPNMQTSNDFANSLANLTLVEAKQRTIEELERKYLLNLLREYHGNVTKIAAAAGMTRRYLHTLLNRYGFEADTWRQLSK